jgi:hypothetical protein
LGGREDLVLFETSAQQVSPDGRLGARVDGDTVTVMEFATGRTIGVCRLSRPGGGPIFSPDGRWLIVPEAGGAFAILDLEASATVPPPTRPE